MTGLPLTAYEPVKDDIRLKHTHIMRHQDHINAVMIELRPPCIISLCKSFDKQTIFKYFDRIRNTDVIAYGFGQNKASTVKRLISDLSVVSSLQLSSS